MFLVQRCKLRPFYMICRTRGSDQVCIEKGEFLSLSPGVICGNFKHVLGK